MGTNIIMKQKTSSGYEELYPKTKLSQIDDLNEYKNAYSIGDTRETARTDLGDDWLLCNGDIIDGGQYPELAQMLPASNPYQVTYFSQFSNNTYFNNDTPNGIITRENYIFLNGAVYAQYGHPQWRYYPLYSIDNGQTFQVYSTDLLQAPICFIDTVDFVYGYQTSNSSSSFVFSFNKSDKTWSKITCSIPSWPLNFIHGNSLYIGAGKTYQKIEGSTASQTSMNIPRDTIGLIILSDNENILVRTSQGVYLLTSLTDSAPRTLYSGSTASLIGISEDYFFYAVDSTGYFVQKNTLNVTSVPVDSSIVSDSTIGNQLYLSYFYDKNIAIIGVRLYNSDSFQVVKINFEAKTLTKENIAIIGENYTNGKYGSFYVNPVSKKSLFVKSGSGSSTGGIRYLYCGSALPSLPLIPTLDTNSNPVTRNYIKGK